MEIISGVFLLLGGIGLFLYGINMISDGLEKVAGNNLRSVLEKMTSKGVYGFLVGTGVTAIIQSSGATCVMVAGFVNAEMMNVSQALYIMLGANIGTTITAQIIAFKVTTIAPLILFVGMLMCLFIKNNTVKRVGVIVLGFGLLFVGIMLMGNAVAQLNLSVLVEKFLGSFSSPLLSVLFGFAITFVIQSSSASVGILQVLVAQSAAVAIGLDSVLYIILGMNIGAVSPVILYSLKAKKRCKRAALAATIAKVLGVVIFIIIIKLLPSVVSFIEDLSPRDVSRQIANLHLFFNIIASVCLCPLVKPISRLCERVISDDETDEATAQKLFYISEHEEITPIIAVEQSKREILRMADLAQKNLNMAIDGFINKKDVYLEQIEEAEETIDFLDRSITEHLVNLYGTALTPSDSERLGKMFRLLKDVERVGDHAMNIAQFAQEEITQNVVFTKTALEEIKDISARTQRILELAIATYRDELYEKLDEISAIEEEVDELSVAMMENHIERLKRGQCSPKGGILFTDFVTDIERCSDHAINIAFYIEKAESPTIKKIFTYDNNEYLS